MASKWQACILLLLSLFTFSSILNTSHAQKGEIAIYWGQNIGDGTLTDTCNTGNYGTVLLAFLSTFGCDRALDANFGSHCGGSSDPCTKLEKEIVHCQGKGVKVFLSLGGVTGDYSLCSTEDAKKVAHNLHDNFLSGKFGPILGNVTLDGIDLSIRRGDSSYWDDLARELDAIRKQSGRYFSMSAAPQCPVPDKYLDKAIGTGLFDDLYVQFYNNYDCQYNGNTVSLLASWDKWTTSLAQPNKSVYMGLPAAPAAAPSGGYIPPGVLITDVLTYIKRTPNYGGVVLWDRYHDIENHYSDNIWRSVPLTVRLLQTVTTVSDAISECVSAALHRILLKPEPL